MSKKKLTNNKGNAIKSSKKKKEGKKDEELSKALEQLGGGLAGLFGLFLPFFIIFCITSCGPSDNDICLEFNGGHTVTCSEKKQIEEAAKKQLNSKYRINKFGYISIDGYYEKSHCYSGHAVVYGPNGYGENKEWTVDFNCVTINK